MRLNNAKQSWVTNSLRIAGAYLPAMRTIATEGLPSQASDAASDLRKVVCLLHWLVFFFVKKKKKERKKGKKRKRRRRTKEGGTQKERVAAGGEQGKEKAKETKIKEETREKALMAMNERKYETNRVELSGCTESV